MPLAKTSRLLTKRVPDFAVANDAVVIESDFRSACESCWRSVIFFAVLAVGPTEEHTFSQAWFKSKEELLCFQKKNS